MRFNLTILKNKKIIETYSNITMEEILEIIENNADKVYNYCIQKIIK